MKFWRTVEKNPNGYWDVKLGDKVEESHFPYRAHAQSHANDLNFSSLAFVLIMAFVAGGVVYGVFS